jgi:hypothetical protein
MASKQSAFFAYPGRPSELSQSVRAAIEKFNQTSQTVLLESWEKNDISGVPLINPIFEKIATGHFLAADITLLNDNVAFEIGYPSPEAPDQFLGTMFLDLRQVGPRFAEPFGGASSHSVGMGPTPPAAETPPPSVA